ncbi:MAG: substrate-binding domain-containing protein [Chitinophagaceae bacterium]|nr:substrate-binding domain-containing protein [Chitinophagaceae bacterium]
MQVSLRHIFNSNGKGVMLGFAFSFFLGGCGNDGNKTPQETPKSGTLTISIDESFKPVIDSQIKVFQSSNPDIKIIARYEPEAQCLRDLTTDSTRMIIVTRGLSSEEEKFYQDSFHLRPQFMPVAYDAIAVIVNNNAKDSIFEIKDLQNMLDGTDTAHLPVMDGRSATSTVRYAMDSLLKGKPLSKRVTAARNSEEVINYVSQNPHAVGFVGINWLGEGEANDNLFIKKVRIASIRCTNCLGPTYVKPYQANIALRRYPLVRSLYYILKENFSGVGGNFANFLQYERGQLIFSKAYLWPAKMSFQIRDTQISN